jgi:hypothetical protein
MARLVANHHSKPTTMMSRTPTKTLDSVSIMLLSTRTVVAVRVVAGMVVDQVVDGCSTMIVSAVVTKCGE